MSDRLSKDPDILIQWFPFVILSGTLPLGDWVILGKSKKECVINYKSPTGKVSRQESSCGLISTSFPVYLSFFLSLSVQISLSVHLVMLCTMSYVFLRAYYVLVPWYVLSLAHLILMTTLWGRHYHHPHFLHRKLRLREVKCFAFIHLPSRAECQIQPRL